MDKAARMIGSQGEIATSEAPGGEAAELCEHHDHHIPGWKKRILQFFGLWGGAAAMYAGTSAACPCCGQPGCPVGIAGAGFVGLVVAGIVHLFRRRPKKVGLTRKNR